MKKLAFVCGLGVAALIGAQDAKALTCKQQCDVYWQECLADGHSPKLTCVQEHKECYAECP